LLWFARYDCGDAQGPLCFGSDCLRAIALRPVAGNQDRRESSKLIKATIYHNPRCSKSRQTLDLLSDHDVETEVVLYLTDPPDRDALRRILGQLSIAAIDLVRKNDHRKLGLNEPHDEDGWLDLMVAHPAIIERPIVVVGDVAVLGRPPENVLKLLT